MKKRKVYRGWIDPKTDIMVDSHYHSTRLTIWKHTYAMRELPCTITVEWTEPKRKGK